MEQHTIRKQGLLNLPGVTLETKTLAERLWLTDAGKHHCFFTPAGLHNHLSHQVLATYDLGAPTGVIKKIYDMIASYQRPIFVEEKDKSIVVTQDNWPDYLGKQEAYGAYFKFFCGEVKKLGPSMTLETYVFRPEANDNGKNMLDHCLSGVLHPFIQIGYATEFGADILIAMGLAQGAVHGAELAESFPYSLAWGHDNVSTPPPSPSKGQGRQPSAGPSLLSVLREICDSPVLAPPLPYDPDIPDSERIKASIEGHKSSEIFRIAKKYTLSIPNDASDEELESRIEELIWIATLIMFATGRPGREPRLDFYLMHLVTSSLFLTPVLGVLKNTRAKVALLRHYVIVLIVTMLSRGRPRIRANLVQEWTEKPRPSNWGRMLGVEEAKDSGVGDIKKDEDYNPWPLLIQGASHHTELHVAKVLRTLIFASRRYGTTGPGGVIGAFRRGTDEETFEGMSQLDGTLFVRAAGVLMDYMKWTLSGDAGRGPEWDRSVLGYDDAWKK